MLYNNKSLMLSLVAASAITSLSTTAVAEDLAKHEAGLRLDVNVGLSSDKPANDMLGYSLMGRYRFNDDWLLGYGLSMVDEFDVERPYKEANLPSPDDHKDVDAKASSRMLSLWAERRYNERTIGGHWFWTAGLGVNEVDIDNMEGTSNGAPLELEIEADTEIVLFGSGGYRHNLSENWAVGYGLSLAYHMGEWTGTDKNTGEKTKLYDNYGVGGAFLETNYRF